MHASSRPFRMLAATVAMATTLAACQTAEQPEAEAPPSDGVQGDVGAPSDPEPARRDSGGSFEARATVVGGELFAIVDGKATSIPVPFTGELLRLEVEDGKLVDAGDVLGALSPDRLGPSGDRFGRSESLEILIVGAEGELARAERDLVAARREIQSLQLLDEERRQFPGEHADREAERLALIDAYEADLRRGRDVLLAPSRAAVIALLEAVRTEQRVWEEALRTERFAVQNVTGTRARLDLLIEQRERRVIRAPEAGVVRLARQFTDDFGAATEMQVGDTLIERQTFATIFAVDRPVVRVAVPDGLISGVENGDRVEVELEAIPGRALGGTVTDISDTDGFGSPGSTRTYGFFTGPGIFGFDTGTGSIERNEAGRSILSGERSGPAQSVFTVQVEIDDAERPLLRPGMTGIASLSRASRGVEVTAEVSELDVHRVEIGGSASVTIDAFPDRTLDATVLSVGRIPLVTGDEVTYRVRLRLDPAATVGLDLRSGLRSTVRFP